MDKIDIDLNEFDKWAGGLPPEIVRKIQLLIGDPKDFSDKGLFDWLLKVGKSQIWKSAPNFGPLTLGFILGTFLLWLFWNYERDYLLPNRLVL